MSLIVMKFGGSSLGTTDRMKVVADRIIEKKEQGHQCVVVVSAMGDTTDELIDLADELTDDAPAREMDMLLSTGEQVSMSLLSMCLQAKNHPAISLTGWQAGFLTDDQHSKAKILDIQPKRIQKALDAGNIIIVAGFQGQSRDGEITTLGRGGSDTTAVALAAVLEADACEIYTDVDGIYSTDPRVVKKARKLEHITYDEMLELAHLGAAVLHPRAVEFAKNYNVPLVVRSSFNHHEGTLVKEEAEMEKGIVVRGIAFDKNVARISVLGVADEPGVLSSVFQALAKENIDVDMIVQSGISDGNSNFSFSVFDHEVDHVIQVLEKNRTATNYSDITYEKGLVKVSIVGAGMVSRPGVAAEMFQIIASQGVNIKMVSTSEIKVSCVIDGEKLTEVVLALHSAYGLDAGSEAFVGGPAERR